MRIDVKNFGTILISRPAGKEAFLALQPLIKRMKNKETIELNFNGVMVLTPSWADEFITPLTKKYQYRIILNNTDNPSIKATLETLKKAKTKHLEET